ncbi:RNA-directed DNA polymerase from mobile element jockey [Vespula maculifrons]|uniref:RNA-directed DNA polymerase from mobile element jockey n=1 Tax=Vespula maculifrons TaxID=7453 RepID=A0ABD2D3P8_VESMC
MMTEIKKFISSSSFALLKMISRKLQIVNTFDKLQIDSYSYNESESSTKIVPRKKRRVNVLSSDYNAKRTFWKETSKVFETWEPTYWPTRVNRTLDLLNFFITKGIIRKSFTIQTCLDLESDHRAVAGVISNQNITYEKRLPILHNAATNWNNFKET